MKHFYAGCIALGILGVADALNVWWGFSPLFRQAFSILELVWLPVCMLMVVICRQNRLRATVPLVYGAFQVAFWMLGLVWIRQSREMGLEFELPPWAPWVAVTFYLFFVVFSWRAFFSKR